MQRKPFSILNQDSDNSSWRNLMKMIPQKSFRKWSFFAWKKIFILLRCLLVSFEHKFADSSHFEVFEWSNKKSLFRREWILKLKKKSIPKCQTRNVSENGFFFSKRGISLVELFSDMKSWIFFVPNWNFFLQREQHILSLRGKNFFFRPSSQFFQLSVS